MYIIGQLCRERIKINGIIYADYMDDLVVKNNRVYNTTKGINFELFPEFKDLVIENKTKSEQELKELEEKINSKFENTGYIFVLMFFASIMIGIIDWTNIGTVIAVNLVDFISKLEFTGSILIAIVFISLFATSTIFFKIPLNSILSPYPIINFSYFLYIFKYLKISNIIKTSYTFLVHYIYISCKYANT